MASRFAVVPNNEILQIIKQAVPEIREEGDEILLGSLTSNALSVWLEFIDESDEKVFFF